MTQEEKQLLLIDLCARLPYNVTCQFTWTYCNETTDGEEVTAKENDNIRYIDIRTEEIQADYYGEWVDLEHCRPYLRPMSSMTIEEYVELKKMTITSPNLETAVTLFWEHHYNETPNWRKDWAYCSLPIVLDWLNKKGFDYRGLIPMGLALVAPEEMYKV